MTNYTPGPWKVETEGIIRSTVNGWAVANVDAIDSPAGLIEATANSRLIATAPELLEALRGIFAECELVHKNWWDDSNAEAAARAIAAARVAIAKAEGK